MAHRSVALALLILAVVVPSAGAGPAGSDFTIAPDPPNPGEEVTFTFVPGPSIVGDPTVQWDVKGNDKFDQTGPVATQSYGTAGDEVTVLMRVTDDDGSVDVSHTFTVNSPPVVSFDFTPTSPFPGQEVWFDQVVTDPDGDTVTLAWSFGDGGTATGEDPRHTYATDGTRTVSLTATDEHGLSTVETRQLTVQDLSGPTASFTISPAVPLVDQPVSFTNSSEPSAGQSLTNAVWDLDNDGEFDDNPAGWSFSTPGYHSVALRVTQTNGNQAVFEKQIRVNAPPTAAFVWSPLTPVASQPVDLISTSTDAEGGLSLQKWDLDNDGEFDDATGANVTHAFAAGTPTIRLRVTDSDGVVRTVTHNVTVLDRPFATFTFSPAVPLVDEVVAFSDQSTASSGSITEAVWDLDEDGQFDDIPLGWSFTSPGNHSVALRVTQTNGQQATARVDIRVNAPPTAGFVWSPLTPVAGKPTDLISTSSDLEGALGAQSWDLDGDGQFDDASGPAFSHAFPRAGTYDVGMQVTDSDGVTRTIRRAVTVASPVGPAQIDEEPGFITPFPVVRLAGKVLPHAARIQVLAVRAPRGARIRVRCVGKGCPVSSVSRTSRGGSTRFPQFERRLRAGIRLKLFVRQDGRIGKYTSFLIRAGAPPKRVDLCLYPTGRSLRRCR